MRHKLAKMRQAAPQELPKARLCAGVIYALLGDARGVEVAEAVDRMKAELGAGWSVCQALQFMSGQRAALAVECGDGDERPALHLAHLVAKAVCHDGGLGAVPGVDGLDLAALRAAAEG